MSKVNLKKNLIYNILYQMIGMIIPLITSPYLSRVLGAKNLGIQSYTLSISVYFSMFVLLGIGNYGNRTIAKVLNSDVKNVEKSFWGIYCIQFFMGIILSISYIFYVLFFANKYTNIAFIQIFCILTNMFDITWFFYGKEDFKLIVFRNTFVKVLGLVLIFVLVKSENDLVVYSLINSLVGLLSQLIMWKQLYKEVKFVRITIFDIKKHIRGILILFIPVLAISVFTNMDKSMIGIYSTVSEVGYYDNANKIIEIPKSLINALGAVMLPRTAALLAQGNEKLSISYIDKTMIFTFFISSPLMFGLIAVSDYFSIIFWGKNFIVSGILIAILSPAFLFSILGNIVRTQYLIPRERDKEYTYSLILGAIVNFIININLIPIYGAYGAAIGTVAAEFLMSLIQILFVERELPMFSYIKQGIVFLFIGLIMLVVIELIKKILVVSFINLIILIVIGAFIYISLSYFYIRFSTNKNINDLRQYIRR